MPPATQIFSSSTVQAIISLGLGASGSVRHSDAGWRVRGASFTASAAEVTSRVIDTGRAADRIHVRSRRGTDMPCRGVLISGKPVHVFVARSITVNAFEDLPR